MVFLLGQTLTFVKEIQQYIYSKQTLTLDRDRFIAYYLSNIGLTAYEKEQYLLAKERFTEALKVYQRTPDSAENIKLLTKYLENIGLTAHEKKDYSLPTECFTQALNDYQCILDSAEDIKLRTKYLEKIKAKQQSLFEDYLSIDSSSLSFCVRMKIVRPRIEGMY
jgi:tetratricopeptide (TPR) repeat protein